MKIDEDSKVLRKYLVTTRYIGMGGYCGTRRRNSEKGTWKSWGGVKLGTGRGFHKTKKGRRQVPERGTVEGKGNRSC